MASNQLQYPVPHPTIFVREERRREGKKLKKQQDQKKTKTPFLNLSEAAFVSYEIEANWPSIE